MKNNEIKAIKRVRKAIWFQFGISSSKSEAVEGLQFMGTEQTRW